MDIALDPIGYSQALQEAGMPRAQADVIARTQQASIEKVVSSMRFVDSSVLRDLATKEELKELDRLARGENAGLHAEIAELRSEIALLRKDMENMGASLRNDMAQMESSLRKDMENMGASLRKDTETMGAGLRKDTAQMEERLIARIDTKIDKARHDMQRWMLTMNIGTIAAIAALFALLK